MDDLSNKIKEVCNIKNISRNDFSSKLDINTYTLQNIERGKQRVPGFLLKLIIEKFNVSPDWLLTDEGEMFRSEQHHVAESVPTWGGLNTCANCGQGFGLESQLLVKQELLEEKEKRADAALDIIRLEQEVVRLEREKVGYLEKELQKKDQEIAYLEQITQIA